MSRELDEVVDRVHERQRRWLTSVVYYPPRYQELQGLVILGRHAVCWVPGNLRWLVDHPGGGALVQVNGVVESPGAVARDWLRVVFRGFNPYKRTLVQSWKRPWALPEPYSPVYARPCEFRWGWYMDLSAMWYAVTCRFGWNVAYSPGRYVGYGRPCDDFPWHDHKKARNALVTSGFTDELTGWDSRRGAVRIKTRNPLLNMPLANLVSDIMHFVARATVEAGACYYYVDAAIAPDQKTRDRIASLWGSWGLTWKVKAEGPGWVAGPGCYRVGPLRSARPKPTRYDGAFSNLRELDPQERKLLDRHLAGGA